MHQRRSCSSMEFSPTITHQVSGTRTQSPYRSHRQTEASPARSSAGYEPFLGSPASGYSRGQQLGYYHHSGEDEHRKLERQVERMMSSPQVKASPKRQYPPFVSCMFAAASSPLSSPSSAPAPSSPLLSSPASASSSPFYPHPHLHSSSAKRQMMWKENNPSAHVMYPHSPADSQSSMSPSKKPSLSHCKRRLDFNHNPVSDNDLDLNLNVNFAAAAAATHAMDELALSFPGDLSPSLPHGQGDAVALGRVPAVAVARRNERERNRVKLINMTFATLREHLPHHSNKDGKNRKMSKVETLRAAIEYIRHLHTLIKEKQKQQQEHHYQQQHNRHQNQHHPSSSDPHPNKDTHEDLHQKSFKMDSAHPVGASSSSVTSELALKGVKMEIDDGDEGEAEIRSSFALSTLELVSSSSPQPPASSSSSLLSRSPGGEGGCRSPTVSDDGCCFSYDLLGTDDEDLLEFASNWF